MDIKELERFLAPNYFEFWNADEQSRIDEDIERYRKADVKLNIPQLAPGETVRVEQLTHSFIFGAHIFNFDQLGSHEVNEKYKALYGTLFNSATIALYWKQFELEEGHRRFAAEERDTEEFWNGCADPKNQPHWRRPASDPVVEFCEKKGIRRHGHPLTWGNHHWQMPEWLVRKLPAKLLVAYDTNKTSFDMWQYLEGFTAGQLEKMLPDYTTLINRLMRERIREIARHYGKRINSYDVCNESAVDFHNSRMIPGSRLCRSNYGLMPGDYTFESFQTAQESFAPEIKLNINDYAKERHYSDQILDLLERGCKIDIAGEQMHLFNPEACLAIGEGRSAFQSPVHVREYIDNLSRCRLPIHLSEITITSPGSDAKGEAIQAVIARNLYRLWFSMPLMMGITWWNVVDDCGAPGEPSVSGLFHRDMTPKASGLVLDDLINREWKTNLSLRAGNNGEVAFRGFRGRYKLTASSGFTMEFELN